MYQKVIKPVLDQVMAIVLLLLLFPVLLIIAVLNLFSGLPVLFTQERPGLYGRGFNIFKICTIKPDGTISKYSAFLRKSSLDELPQLLNVLKGEMSLVGPRPLFMAYLELFSEKEKQRHLVKPGMTGLAQVTGRNELTLKQKVEIDLKYVETLSFRTDLLIMFRTLLQIFKGSEADGHTSQFKSENA